MWSQNYQPRLQVHSPNFKPFHERRSEAARPAGTVAGMKKFRWEEHAKLETCSARLYMYKQLNTITTYYNHIYIIIYIYICIHIFFNQWIYY